MTTPYPFEHCPPRLDAAYPGDSTAPRKSSRPLYRVNGRHGLIMSYDRIPKEMHNYPQWVVWRYEDRNDKRTKVPYDAKTGRVAAVDRPESWVTFHQAVSAQAAHGYDGIGFVLTEIDPYCLIDLDATDDAETLQRQIKIYEAFDSYAERSPSGLGCHIIIKGHVPTGRRRGNVEIYSSLRYMTMTGDVLADKPISERQALAQLLWAEMSRVKDTTIAVDVAQTIPDQEVLRRASTAANGSKFIDLYEGRWERHYGNRSQSEADFALIDMLAFYTQNIEQIIRLFRASELGKRPKAFRIDYVMGMVNRAFDRMLPPLDFTQLDQTMRRMIDALKSKEAAPGAVSSAASDPYGGLASGSTYATVLGQQPIDEDHAAVNPLSFPPGLMGMIADFLLKRASRGVPEVALAGAMGLMAGICGRAYLTPTNAGHNLYVLAIAKTGAGKESMQTGINQLVNSISTFGPASHPGSSMPSISEFLGPRDIRSDIALVKAIGRQPSMVAILPELGVQLEAMNSLHASPHLTQLRSALLDVFGKSDGHSVWRPSVYSDDKKNTEAIYRPAFSILSDSNPDSFYRALSDHLIEQGLLPRFIVLEYKGKVNYADFNSFNVEPSEDLKRHLMALAITSMDLNRRNHTISVKATPEAMEAFMEYDRFTTDRVNESQRGTFERLWSRAALNALKLAGLASIGINFHQPVISLDAWLWAKGIVHTAVVNMVDKFEAGEIGTQLDMSHDQLNDTTDAIVEYMSRPYEELKGYLPITEANLMHGDKVIPMTYFTLKLSRRRSFNASREGAKRAIENILRQFVDMGWLQEYRANQLKDQSGNPRYVSHGKVFVVADPAAFIARYHRMRSKR